MLPRSLRDIWLSSFLRGTQECPFQLPRGCIRAMLLNHLVVDAEQEEGSSPLADEKCVMALARCFQGQRSQNGSDRRPEKQARRQPGRLGFQCRGEWIFLYIACAYSIVRH